MRPLPIVRPHRCERATPLMLAVEIIGNILLLQTGDYRMCPASSYISTPDGLTTLVASQDQIFWSRLLDLVDVLASRRANDKKLDLLALVGLLEFASVYSKEELDQHVRGVVTRFRFLLKAAENQKPVKRFFAFRGLTMIGPQRLVNDRKRIHRLVDDLDKYPIQTPALRLMHDHLSSRR